jgi:hypothetical protein
MHLVYNSLLCIHVVDEYHVSSPHDPTTGRSGCLSWSTWAASVMGQPSGQRKDHRRWIILLYTWQQIRCGMHGNSVHTVCTEFCPLYVPNYMRYLLKLLYLKNIFSTKIWSIQEHAKSKCKYFLLKGVCNKLNYENVQHVACSDWIILPTVQL